MKLDGLFLFGYCSSMVRSLKRALIGLLSLWLAVVLTGSSALAASGDFSRLNSFSHKLLHGAAGALTQGIASGGDKDAMVAGAIGAVVGEIAAESTNSEDGRVKHRVGQIAARAVARLFGKDPNIAGAAAANAIQNNYLTHRESKALKKAKAACVSGDNAGCQEAERLHKLDVARDRNLTFSCRERGSAACLNAVAHYMQARASFSTGQGDATHANVDGRSDQGHINEARKVRHTAAKTVSKRGAQGYSSKQLGQLLRDSKLKEVLGADRHGLIPATTIAEAIASKDTSGLDRAIERINEKLSSGHLGSEDRMVLEQARNRYDRARTQISQGRLDDARETMRVAYNVGSVEKAIASLGDDVAPTAGTVLGLQKTFKNLAKLFTNPKPNTKATNRVPNPIPVEQGLARTSDIRSGLTVGNNRTVAYSEVNVTGVRGDVIGVSGQANRGSSYNGATVAGNTSRTGPGRQDAEVKILDHLRTQLTPQSSGTIRLFVDQPAARGVCQHCTNAILQFRRDFPNIRLDVSAN